MGLNWMINHKSFVVEWTFNKSAFAHKNRSNGGSHGNIDCPTKINECEISISQDLIDLLKISLNGTPHLVN